jgi:hypothetical protein
MREADSERALVGLNFTPRPQRIPIQADPGPGTWRLALSSISPSTADLTANDVLLGPHEAAIFIAS